MSDFSNILDSDDVPLPDVTPPGSKISPEAAHSRILDYFGASAKTRAGLDVNCPACGSAMVVRTRNRDGVAFLGCTGWPHCSGGRDIPAEAQSEARRRASMYTKGPGHEASQEAARAESMKHMMNVAKRPLSQEADLPEEDPEDVYDPEEQEAKVEEGDKDYIVPKPMKGKSAMKESVQTEAASEEMRLTIKERLKRSATKAPYRVARMRALTDGREKILQALKPRLDPGTFEIVEGFLDSDAGQGTILGLIGLAGPSVPKFGKDRRVQALCEEFLDEGVAKGMNQVLSLLKAILEPALESAVAALPEVAETVADATVHKNKRKKRVAVAPPSEARSRASEEDDDEEQGGRPLRAVASR